MLLITSSGTNHKMWNSGGELWPCCLTDEKNFTAIMMDYIIIRCYDVWYHKCKVDSAHINTYRTYKHHPLNCVYN